MEDCYYNLFLLGERDKLQLQTNFVTVYHGGKIALQLTCSGKCVWTEGLSLLLALSP